MYKILVSIGLLYVFVVQIGLAQSQSAYYKVGDTISLVVDKVQNHHSSQIKLPATAKKLTLIEIWGVGCAACIKGMPLLQLKQSKFDNDLQVVLLCEDSLKRFNAAKERSIILQNIRLPIITAESGLHKKFQYSVYGTYVWLDQDGVIRYITNGEHKTDQNIRAFIAGQDLPIPEKIDIAIDSKLPVKDNLHEYLEDNQVADFFIAKKSSKFSYRSGIYTHLDTGANSVSRIYSYGTDMRQIFKYLLEKTALHNSLVVFEGLDLDGVIPDDPHIGNNRFVFDLNLNKEKIDIEAKQYLADQLKELFAIEGKWGKRKTKCYVLKKTNDIDIGTTALLKENYLDVNFTLHLKKSTWSDVVYSMNSGAYAVGRPPYVVVDETGMLATKLVDLSFHLRFDDLSIMNASLKPFGLYIEEGERLLDVIIVSKMEVN